MRKNQEYSSHPFKGFLFKGVEVPNWSKIKEFALLLHSELFHFDIASWEIEIDEKQEHVFIEVNLKAQDVNFHKRNNAPSLGELTKGVVSYGSIVFEEFSGRFLEEITDAGFKTDNLKVNYGAQNSSHCYHNGCRRNRDYAYEYLPFY